MGRYFTDTRGNYYEATTDIATPAGHTAVAKRLPPVDPADVAAEVRAARDERLRESDFDVLRMFLGENLPVPREWRDYRQALRDLPQQANPSIPIIWPGKPGADDERGR